MPKIFSSEAARLLDELLSQGRRLERAGDRLRISGGPGPLPADLARRVRDRRDELLAMVDAGEAGRRPGPVRELLTVESSDGRREQWMLEWDSARCRAWHVKTLARGQRERVN